jgi:hypothetical protein
MSELSRRTNRVALVKKMAAPTVALALVGVMVGGYFAFNGEGGKQHKAKAAKVAAASEVQHPTTHVAAPSVAHPSPESANAATATAGADQPEPPAPADKAEAPKSDDAKTEAAKTAPAATSEPAAKTEAAAAPSIAAKSEPAAKTDAIVAATTGPAAAAKTATAAKTEPAVAPAAAKTEPAVKSAAIATAAPSAIHEIQTTRGVVKLVDVRIDSKPAGATVMLVDNGKTNFLGTTPIATSLDPSRSYDVIFTLQGRPTQMTHLDPAKQPRLEMTLGKTGGSVTSVAPVPSPAKTVTMPAPTPKAAPAATTPASAHHHSAPAHAAPAPLADPGFDSTPAPKADKNPTKVEKAAKTDDAPKADAPKADKKPAKVEKVAKTDDAPKAVKTDAPKADKAVAGQGMLMVSSKPPCEIWIDGKSTGLTTPQRAIPLPAGTHKVTFQNTAQNITKTVAVSITADQTTKLAKDLLAQ